MRWWWLCSLLLLAACNRDPLSAVDASLDVTVDSAVPADAARPDVFPPCKDPNGDWDGDKLTNSLEGCDHNRDSDGDRVADWQDLDSDADMVPDNIEAGQKDLRGRCKGASPGQDLWPCDSDGDKAPDHLDQDSDDDGLSDGYEETTWDDQVGCCLSSCGKPGWDWQNKNCTLTVAGCGRGQTCVAGKCHPRIVWDCAEGETDRRNVATFGVPDSDPALGLWACRPRSPHRGVRRTSLLRKNLRGGGSWVAVVEGAAYGKLKIKTSIWKMAAVALDHGGASAQVAGFATNRDTTRPHISGVLTDLKAALLSTVPGGKGTVILVSAGKPAKSHDRFDLVHDMELRVTLTSATSISAVRDALVPLILGKKTAEISGLPKALAAKGKVFVVRLAVVRRFDFKRIEYGGVILDASGYPVDSGDKSYWEVVTVGGVALETHHDDEKRTTGRVLDDLAGGLYLAGARGCCYELRHQCDTYTLATDRITVNLDRTPIPASLVVALDGRQLHRGRDFAMKAGTRSLSLEVPSPTPGARLIVGYQSWEYHRSE